MVLSYWRRCFRLQAALAEHTSGKQSPRKRRRRPQFEVLEDRLAPATHTWTGAVSSLWSLDRNWVGGAPASTETNVALIFPNVAANFASLNDIPNLSIQSLNLSAAQSGYTLSGQAITLSGGLNTTTPPSIATNISFGITLNAAQSWLVSGKLALNGPITLGADLTLSMANASTTAFAGALSGPGGLSMVGGTTVLSAANSYTGLTVVNSAGTLLLGAANAVPSTSAVTVGSGATFNENGLADRIASLAGAGNVILGIDVGGSLFTKKVTLYAGRYGCANYGIKGAWLTRFIPAKNL